MMNDDYFLGYRIPFLPPLPPSPSVISIIVNAYPPGAVRSTPLFISLDLLTMSKDWTYDFSVFAYDRLYRIVDGWTLIIHGFHYLSFEMEELG